MRISNWCGLGYEVGVGHGGSCFLVCDLPKGGIGGHPSLSTKGSGFPYADAYGSGLKDGTAAGAVARQCIERYAFGGAVRDGGSKADDAKSFFRAHGEYMGTNGVTPTPLPKAEMLYALPTAAVESWAAAAKASGRDAQLLVSDAGSTLSVRPSGELCVRDIDGHEDMFAMSDDWRDASSLALSVADRRAVEDADDDDWDVPTPDDRSISHGVA